MDGCLYLFSCKNIRPTSMHLNVPVFVIKIMSFHNQQKAVKIAYQVFGANFEKLNYF